MVKLLQIIIFSPMLLSVQAGGMSQTVDSPAITVQAMIKTDHQIDSIYSNTNESRYLDALKNNFGLLQHHIDSLNAEGIIRQRKIERASIERDSVMYALTKLTHRNSELNKLAIEQRETIVYMKSIPNYLMMFATVFMAVCFSTGFINWFAKRKKHAA